MKTSRITLMRALLIGALAVFALVGAASRAGAAGHSVKAVVEDDAAPVWSPDGKTIAFSSCPACGKEPYGIFQIYTVNSNGGSRRELTHGNLSSEDLAWSPSGKQIAFSKVTPGQEISAGHVYVMNANGGSLREVTRGGGGYDEFLGWSPDGTTLQFDRITDGIGAIFTVGLNGTDLHELTPNPNADDDYWGVWSPNGKKIAFDRTAPSAFGDIWVMNADGSGQKRLTTSRKDDFGSAWSPDNTRIAFMSDRTGSYEVYVMPATGGPQRQLSHTTKGNNAEAPRWSPDGKQILYQGQVNGNYELFVVNANGGGTKQLTNVAFDNTDPTWSPDGKQIAFLTTRNGGSDVYVMNADGSDQHKVG